MYTISDIISDINRGCMINNMLEDCFSYRIVFFVNEGNGGKKYYIDAEYRDLRKSLEGIIRKYLSMSNNIVIAQTTVMKNGKCVCLQNKSYSFSLDEYLRRVSGVGTGSKRSTNYGKYAIR